jgi:hypothetical protein
MHCISPKGSCFQSAVWGRFMPSANLVPITIAD